MRERIDVSEIEATTKIRAKYLRALENEEWSLLPGPTFVKSFLRTYAEALGLDATVRFDVTDDDIRPASARRPGPFQHRVGLTHAGRGAKEDPQPSAPRSRLLPLDVSQQFVRIAALSLGHCFSAAFVASVRQARGSLSARRY